MGTAGKWDKAKSRIARHEREAECKKHCKVNQKLSVNES